jgi:hypothetical protein
MRVRLERRGDDIALSVMVTNGIWESAGCSVRMSFSQPVVAGLMVCAHDDEVSEEARFSRVQFSQLDAHRTQADYDKWEKEVTALEDRDRKNPPPKEGILFLGSSTIRMWKTLGEDFPGLPVYAHGIGGSWLADSIYFADRLVFPYHPRQIVVYAGSNDLDSHRTPERVLSDFKILVKTIQARLPQTRIMYLPVRPCEVYGKFLDKVRITDELLQAYCATDARLLYIDTYTCSLTADGQLRPEIFMADQLHLNREGYAIWSAVIRPYLKL